MDERTTTLKAILRTDELPTLPDVVHQILAITGDPMSSMRELTDVIERDPSLSANLLRMVNSAYFGLSRKIYAIHNAGVLLGYETIRALALGTSVITGVDVDEAFDTRAFWGHSLAAAMGASILAREMNHEHQDMAFIGGLLHDVGKLLFAVNLPVQTRTFYADAGSEESCLNREVAAFGIDHAEAGGSVARHWKFDPVLTRAIEHHHLKGVSLDQANPLARLLFLAEWAAHEYCEPDGPSQELDEQVDQVARSLGSSLKKIEALQPEFLREMGAIDAILSLGGSSDG